MPIPRVLVIAGSDSSGGAGLEADQRTLAAHGAYTMTATTALTAQNTTGVEDVHVTPPAFVGKQIRKVMEDGFMEGVPGVIKMGMLASAETIRVVAETLRDWREKTGKELKIVLDPVMVATSGAQLLAGDAVRNLGELLLPMTTVLTPNIPEATLLLRDADIHYRSPSDIDDLKAIAKQLHQLGPKHILLKGGHMPLTKNYQKATTDNEKAITVDILYPSTPGGSDYEIIEFPYLTIPNTHGTGCSLASSLAANLASTPPPTTTLPLTTSVRNAITYVANGILTSPTLQTSLHNSGPGPINHLHSLLPSPFPLGHFIPYLLSHPRITPVWHRYTHHPFPTALAAGTLPLQSFKHYLIQDYLYLTHFARAYALAGYKSPNISQTTASADIVLHIKHEMEMHLTYCCEDFGMSRDEIENSEESQACTAYSRYVLDVGMRGDVLGLFVALAPCLIGYGVVAGRLAQQAEKAGAAAATRGSDDRFIGKATQAQNKVEEAEEGDEDGKGGNIGNNTPQKHGNRYWKWIENYTADDYTAAVVKGRQVIEDAIITRGGIGRGTAEELVEVFRRATEMEIAFWDIDEYDTSTSRKERERKETGGSGFTAS